MTTVEIFKFLLPTAEILPVVFCSVIWGLFFLTIIVAKINGKPKNWQNNWEKGGGNTLDVEHGSVYEISDAVSTKSEKMADAMPGLILVIGLLGTFIGLGLALDKASTILTSASATGMDNAMADLMKMMEGLGAKFKTSTWGLIAFLLLKPTLSWIGYESKRLNWSIEKVNELLKLKRNNETQQTQDLLTNINLFSDRMAEIQEKQLLQEKDQHHNLVEFIQAISSAITQQQATQQNLFSSLENKLATQAESYIGVIKDSQNKQIQSIETSNNQLKQTLTELSQSQISAIENAQQIQKATTENANKQFVHTLQKNHQDNVKLLNETVSENRKTQEAMTKFVESNLGSINSLKESAQNMSKSAHNMSSAAEKVGASAKELQSVIDSFGKEMKSVVALMKQDLSQTIANMSKNFDVNMQSMTKNLSVTINDMNNSFKQNMTVMTNNLGNATGDISKAVNSLSESVKETMDKTAKALSDSADKQRIALELFSTMTNELTEEVAGMTNLVNRLSDDITSGLEAVSASNRNIISLNKNYNNSSEQIKDLVNSIQNVSNNNDQMKSVFAELKQSLQQLGSAELPKSVSLLEQQCGKLANVLSELQAKLSNNQIISARR